MAGVIYLVRHGIAGPASEGMSDADRSLTAEGSRRMHRIATGLKRLGVKPTAVLSSPLRRAEETAAALAAVLAPKVPVQVSPLLAPGHSPAEVVKTLRPFRAASEIVLVGHQPDLGLLASHLLAGSATAVPLPFKKGAVAAIGVTAIPPREAGELLWFMTSKQLRAIAGHGK
jgi:phosphohistidine phosphatase